MDSFFDIIKNVINGIKSAWSLVKNCVLNFTQKTISLFKKDKVTDDTEVVYNSDPAPVQQLEYNDQVVNSDL